MKRPHCTTACSRRMRWRAQVVGHGTHLLSE